MARRSKIRSWVGWGLRWGESICGAHSLVTNKKKLNIHRIVGSESRVWMPRARHGRGSSGLGTVPSVCLYPTALHAHDPVFKCITHSPKVQVSRGGDKVGQVGQL